MKTVIKLIYFALIIVLFSCKEDSVKPEEEFTLGFGEEKSFDQYTISFTNLNSDSRCPSDAVCFWAGQARVTIRIVSPAGFSDFELVNGAVLDGQQTAVDWQDYTFELLDVSPYPKWNTSYDEADYSLKLVIHSAD